MSLAHHGVLFLDELPEFKRSTLEVLRQPLEDGVVTISRAATSITFPARFMLVASMNPCFCGFHGDAQRVCTCTPQKIQHYRARISGPLAGPHRYSDAGGRGGLSGFGRRGGRRVFRRDAGPGLPGPGAAGPALCRRRQVFANAQMTSRLVQAHCALGPEARRLLEAAVERLGLSARAYTRILKIARTIADLEGAADITLPHVAEAVQYRSLDRKFSSPGGAMFVKETAERYLV